MNRYHKIVAFFSYLFGAIAFLAVLIDDKKERLFSFHIWQALFLNLFVAILLVPTYLFWVPQHIYALAIDQRTAFFLQVTIIPMIVVFVILLTLGILAAMGMKFKIPIINLLVEKIIN